MISVFKEDLRTIKGEIAAHGTDSCPPKLLQAIVCAEDRRFYHHIGVDPIAIIRALLARSISGRREGASTIEMQLVRTITRRNEISIARKLREMGLALLVSRCAEKVAILQTYANVAYLGFPMRGVKAACRELGYQYDHLSELQSCEIAARLKVPFPGAAESSAAGAAKLRARTGRIRSRLYSPQSLLTSLLTRCRLVGESTTRV